MSATKWQRPGFISLLDEIERRGRERYGSEWPQPPTEDDIRTEGQKHYEEALRRGLEKKNIGINIDEYMGPDLRTVGDEPFAKLFALNVSQTIRRNNIVSELNDKYEDSRKEKLTEIIIEIRSDLFQGIIQSICESGLKDIGIDRMWWRLPEAEAALMTGSHAGFEIFLKGEEPTTGATSVSKIGDGTKAKACRVERMTQSPKKPQGITDKTLFADMKKQFPNLPKRAFDRAKAAAIEETGALDWKKGGRR